MENIKIDIWDAFTFYDEKRKLYFIWSKSSGGAIISNSNFELAKNNFIDAMNLAESIKKLSIFNINRKFK